MEPTVIHHEDGTTRIELFRKGQPSVWAVIDTIDWPRVAPYRWFAHSGAGRATYVRSTPHVPGHRFTIHMHRMILPPGAGQVVDHVDGDGLNNRRSNLRIATASQNLANQKKQKPGASGFKGVFPDKKAWAARVVKDGVPHRLGTYDTPEEAALAYDRAARELFGEFALTNFALEDIENAPHPRRRPKRVAGNLPHGRGKYTNEGCRCDVCRAAESAYQRARTARRALARQAARSTAAPSG